MIYKIFLRGAQSINLSSSRARKEWFGLCIFLFTSIDNLNGVLYWCTGMLKVVHPWLVSFFIFSFGSSMNKMEWNSEYVKNSRLSPVCVSVCIPNSILAPFISSYHNVILSLHAGPVFCTFSLIILLLVSFSQFDRGFPSKYKNSLLLFLSEIKKVWMQQKNVFSFIWNFSNVTNCISYHLLRFQSCHSISFQWVDIRLKKYEIIYMKGLVIYLRKCIEGLCIKRNFANTAL